MKLQDEDLAREALRQQESTRQEPRQQRLCGQEPKLQQQSEAGPAPTSRWAQFCTEPAVGAPAHSADTGGGHASSAASSRWAQFCTEEPGRHGDAAIVEDGGSAHEVDQGVCFVTTFDDAAVRRNSGRGMRAALGRGRAKRPAWNSQVGEDAASTKRFRGRKHGGVSAWASAPCDGKENRETAPVQLDKQAALSTVPAASSRWARFMN